ncbi:MAG: hypothetical protein ACLFWR_08575 [Acidimicrobiales bacterium]
MLLNVTGSSCAGKSTLIWRVESLLGRSDVVVADFDEIGVPDDAGTDWRHVANEQWVQRALDLQLQGRHLLVSSQTPLGELLATPSAVELEAIANCLVDVADDDRLRRLGQRDPATWSEETLEAFVRWGRWHRHHAEDPTHLPDVIVKPSSVPMAWDRWADWSAGDPRWTTAVVDTTGRSVDDAARDLLGWVIEQLRRLDSGALPLRKGWLL